MRIHVWVLPFAVTFELVDIGEGGLDDDEGGGETDQAHECHEDVDGGDLHVWGLYLYLLYHLFQGKPRGLVPLC